MILPAKVKATARGQPSPRRGGRRGPRRPPEAAGARRLSPNQGAEPTEVAEYLKARAADVQFPDELFQRAVQEGEARISARDVLSGISSGPV